MAVSPDALPGRVLGGSLRDGVMSYLLVVDATYSVAEQGAPGRRSATVTVRLTEAAVHQVVMAVSSPDPAWTAEATAGAWHGLRSCSARPLRVEIAGIVADLDTNVGDVHEATARAVWEAAGTGGVYVGFSEPQVVRAWLEARRGQTLRAITEARHWYGGRPSGLLHLWLQFERGMPTQLHGSGDTLFLHPGLPYEPYDMAEHGQTRVGPVESDSVLATVLGRRLVGGGTIVEQFTPVDSCSGIVLRTDSEQIAIATVGDEWVISD